MTEEQALVNSLKDIVTGGYKADNGFRTGYLGLLEAAMAKELLGTDLKVDPHISSKIHIWKKQFGTLFSMVEGDRSGFEWNYSTNTIEVKDEEKWQHFVKMDGNAKNMRTSLSLSIRIG